ncbi:MAG: chain length determinant protein EpsF [Candidatus Nitricoxidivorans perseverans]|uniref:Chain length determinant protein EpsF n=1 Tax=Candidatus Nitricoxidivorans perseverans TaxID=2975601 RepID=A0AA49FM29_9PROT|nr:MAG: chain length determinant protein EpsF [Candidatus Nitricoxidivorans perseverans]
MNFPTFLAILHARLRLIILVLGATVATAAIVSLLLPPVYKATTTVMVDAKSKDPVTGAMQPISLMVVAGYAATQVDIISSHNVAAKVVDALKLAESPQVKADFLEETEGRGSIRDWLADKLLEKLTVTPSRESSAIDIDFKAPDPRVAAAVANAFATAYIDTSLELRTEPARQVSTWYEGQLRQLRGNLEKAQIQLSEYQRARGLVASDERLDVETSRLSELSSQLVAAQSSSYDATSRQGSEGADVMNSGVVQQLRTDLARREAELAQFGQNLGQNHPQYQRTKAEVETLRAKLEAEKGAATRVVSSTASSARQREASLRAAMASQKERVLDLKKQRDELSVLARDVENAQRIYDSALQRYSQSQLEAKNTQTEIAILNPAVAPIEKDSPKLLLNLVVATFLGGMLALGAALLMEMIDRRVRGAQDIISLLGIPVLSVLAPEPRPWFARKTA